MDEIIGYSATPNKDDQGSMMYNIHFGMFDSKLTSKLRRRHRFFLSLWQIDIDDECDNKVNG